MVTDNGKITSSHSVIARTTSLRPLFFFCFPSRTPFPWRLHVITAAMTSNWTQNFFHVVSKPPIIHYTGPEEAQGLQRFWPLHHLAFKFLNLTCHVMCSLHELLCIPLIMSCNVLLVCHELCKPHNSYIILIYWSLMYTRNTQIL